MSVPPHYTLHHHQHHLGWNHAFPPVLKIAPGDRVTIDVIDAGGGQLSPSSTHSDILHLDSHQANPVTGPIWVADAEPGDVLKIQLQQFQTSGWGWTANIPGFGLLADQFTDPYLHIWHYAVDTLAPAAFGDWARVPLKPFTGTIGVAPAEPGTHSIIPPRRVGGNMDIRDLSVGTTLYLPVEVAGALLSVGDTHAAQGDGEVCGTAIESPMQVTLQVDLLKNTPLHYPRFTTAGPVTRHLDTAGYEVTTGIEADLMTATRAAVMGMIDLLTRQYQLPPTVAYLLCSVCGDLRISEVVDIPHWVVSFYFPRCVFE